jgi:hypothetical protein
MSEEFIDRKDILITYLTQIRDWRSNLELPQKERKRKDCNDITTVHSVKYWYQGYVNGLILHGWIK